MRLLFSLIGFLAFSLYYSQKQDDVLQIFSYRLVFVSDSTNLENIKQEDFSLQYKSGKSCFVSDNYKSAYLMARNFDLSPSKITSLNMNTFPKSKFNLAVYKEKDSIELYESLFSFKVKLREKRNFKWFLTKEKKKIDNYNCQKATTEYGGRKWEAWFTSDIPISEGPYKFSGLPGLIIDLKDSKNSYHFYLIQVQKAPELTDVFYNDYFKKYKEINRVEYFEARENLKNNYVNAAENNGITFRQEDKREIQNRVNKNNNPIELKY